MATYTTLADSGFDPGKPITQAQGLALRDNPTAIAERASGAPLMRPSQKVYLTSGTAATWNLPDADNMTTFEVWVLGAGGGGGQSASGGSAGGNSSFTYDGTTYTANGGGGATTSAAGTGGTASGGDLNINGGDGETSANENKVNAQGAASFFGGGNIGSSNLTVGAGGAGRDTAGSPQASGGGAGALCIGQFTVDPAVTSATYTVGSGGSGGTDCGDGGHGLIIIVY